MLSIEAEMMVSGVIRSWLILVKNCIFLWFSSSVCSACMWASLTSSR